MDKYRLINANSYEQIDKFIEEGMMVDHIITDPPYNISQDNNFGTMKNPRAGVDFGTWIGGILIYIPGFQSIQKY